MDSNEFIRHKFFIDNFWEEFGKKLDERNTEDEYHSLFQFEIGVQERKLNQYKEKYRPNLYTEDAVVVNGQKVIVQKLKALYEQFRNDNFNTIEPIKLAYDANNRKVIELLHKILHPNFIKCSFDDFSLHFTEQDDYTPIQWHKSETCIADLFKDQIKILNDDWAMLVVNHFLNKNGERYKREQITSVGANRISANYRNSETIKSIDSEISIL